MAVTVPTEITDPVNARILAVSEDRIAGFLEDPFVEIARLSELPVDTVLERLRAMLESGVIRRIRQTLMATNLRSEEHTSELHHVEISYAVFCLKKKKK